MCYVYKNHTAGMLFCVNTFYIANFKLTKGKNDKQLNFGYVFGQVFITPQRAFIVVRKSENNFRFRLYFFFF